MKNLRILIVEDSVQRLQSLVSLLDEYAWIAVETATRANCLLGSYDFDLIFLDYNLANDETGAQVAKYIQHSGSKTAQIIVHSMNVEGSKEIQRYNPKAQIIPAAKLFKKKAIFKRLKIEVKKGQKINWDFVIHGY